jgi:HPt (histidine-containing phosphotransfer) domain-containing protein
MHSILAVDDSISMRQMVSFTLKNAGLRRGRGGGRRRRLREGPPAQFRPGPDRPEHAAPGRHRPDQEAARAPQLQDHPDPDPDHRVERPDEAGRPRRRRHRLAGQALRPGQADRSHQEGRPYGLHGRQPASDRAGRRPSTCRQFHQVFFEEAGENLDRMEQQLLEIDIESADDETLNSIFRCAHSVKGGAATFGFADVAALTHQMETLLDKLRRHELAPNAAWSTCCCNPATRSRRSWPCTRAGGKGEPIDTAGIAGQTYAPSSPVRRTGLPSAAVAAVSAPRRPHGRCRRPRPAQGPAWAGDAGRAAGTPGRRRPAGRTVRRDHRPGHASSRWTVASRRRHAPLQGHHRQHRRRPAGPVHFPCRPRQGQAAAAGPGLRLPFRCARRPARRSTAPGRQQLRILRRCARRAGQLPPCRRHGPRRRYPPHRPHRRPCDTRQAARPEPKAEASTLRVSVEKVDQLINLVGELVITQAMLAQTSTKIDSDQTPAAGLRPGRPGAPHPRPAGIGDVDPHDSDVHGLQPLPAHAARPGRPSSNKKVELRHPWANPPSWTRAWSRRSPTR